MSPALEAVEPVAGLVGAGVSLVMERVKPLAQRVVSWRERFEDVFSVLLAMGVSVAVRALTATETGEGVRPLRLVFAIVSFDLVLYVLHRLNHTKWTWAMHKVHHTPTHFDVGMAMRGSVLYLVLFALAFSLIARLWALSLAETVWLSAVFFLFQWWIHSNVAVSLGALDFVLIGPRHHAMHHMRGGFERNFGGLLCAWDQLFGTYAHPPRDMKGATFGIGDGRSSAREWLGIG